MMGLQSVQRLWTTKVRPHPPTRLRLSASERCRINLPLEHSRRRNQYQAYQTRLRTQDQTAIKEYLAASDKHPAVVRFISSLEFVRDITGYTFVNRHLLLQALYGEGGSEFPQQRLAMLGDMLLQHILKDDWFELGLTTSRIGEIASQVATNANLTDIARKIGLLQHLGVLYPKIATGKNEHYVGTVMEALLGAIHEDSGKDIEAVRRAMYSMGLRLPEWYMEKSELYEPRRYKTRSELIRHNLHVARPELDQSDLNQARSGPKQLDFDKAKPELNQSDVYDTRSERKQSELRNVESEWGRTLIRKTHPTRLPNRSERRRMEWFQRRQAALNQSPSEDKVLDQRNLGCPTQTTEEQVTSDEDFEALDAARARLDDMDAGDETPEDYDIEQAVLEDADLKSAHVEDQDADQTGLETSATHQESVEPTAAGFTSSSWRQVVLESSGPSTEPKTAKRKKSATSPDSGFDSAIGALMIESDDSPMKRELASGDEWPICHGWFPQRCQITLDIALSKKHHPMEEVAACEPDPLMAAPTPDDVALSKNLQTTKQEEAYELDPLLAGPTLNDVVLSERPTKELAADELDQLLAAPTIDNIALPKLAHTTKEVVVYEPDRLRLIAVPYVELDSLLVAR